MRVDACHACDVGSKESKTLKVPLGAPFLLKQLNLKDLKDYIFQYYIVEGRSLGVELVSSFLHTFERVFFCLRTIE